MVQARKCAQVRDELKCPRTEVCSNFAGVSKFLFQWGCSGSASVAAKSKSWAGERPTTQREYSVLTVSSNGLILFPLSAVLFDGQVSTLRTLNHSPMLHGKIVCAHPFIHERINMLLSFRWSYFRALPVVPRWWIGSDWWQGNKWGNLGIVGSSPCRRGNGEIGCGCFHVAQVMQHSPRIHAAFSSPVQTAPPDPGMRPRGAIGHDFLEPRRGLRRGLGCCAIHSSEWR